jgi:prolyl-tRNA synthetase
MSQLFTKTSKTHPADETSKNAQLLIQAGYVYKVMAGVYAYTPLGLALCSRTSNRSSAKRWTPSAARN